MPTTTNPFTTPYRNPFTPTRPPTGGGGGTYNPSTGVYTSPSGQGYSYPTAPAGSTIVSGGGGGGHHGGGGGTTTRTTTTTTPTITLPVPTYNPLTGVYTSSTGQSQSMAVAPLNAIIVGTTNPLVRTYVGPGSSAYGTYISDAGVYQTPVGQFQSMAQAPTGAKVVLLDQYQKETMANYRANMIRAGWDPDTNKPIMTVERVKTPGEKFKEGMKESEGGYWNPANYVWVGGEWVSRELQELRKTKYGQPIAGFGQGVLDISLPIAKVVISPSKGIPEFVTGTKEMVVKAFTTGFPEVSQVIQEEPGYALGYVGGMYLGAKGLSKIEVKGIEKGKEYLTKIDEYVRYGPEEISQGFPIKTSLEKSFEILKRQKIDVGNLRLERLKDIPKDPEVHTIIKDFVREKGLDVGGTTAIETLRINDEVVNLRRTPRDLEVYDELQRNPKLLAQELYGRLKSAGKDVTLEGSQIGFKGIEGHGVNFQNIEILNIERYRYKIWTNPEGIRIADPMSTAYNKVADLLKRGEIGTFKAKKIAEKLGTPEKIERATAEGYIYERYSKDVSGAYDVAEQSTKLLLKQFADFTQRQIPLYQEFKMMRLGQSAEVLKPYAKAIKSAEEVKVMPHLGEGKPIPGVFSGVKYIDSYTLELSKKMLVNKKAMMGSMEADLKIQKKIFSEYEYIGGKQYTIPNYPIIKIPKVPFYPSYPIPTKPTTVSYPITEKSILDYPSIPEPSVPVYPSVPSPKKPSVPTYPSPPGYPEYPTPPIKVVPNIPSYPSIPVIEIPSMPGEKPRYFEKKVKKEVEKYLGEGYDVYGKIINTNKFEKINTIPITKTRAMDIGAYYVDNTLARTFKVVKSGKKAKEDMMFGYIPLNYYQSISKKLREYKIKQGTPYAFGQQFIEKKGLGLLDTPQERRDIKRFQQQVMRVAK